MGTQKTNQIASWECLEKGTSWFRPLNDWVYSTRKLIFDQPTHDDLYL